MIIAIALAASVFLGTETTIYKSTAPDGSVTYSSQGPEPDAARVDEMHILTKPAAPALPSEALADDTIADIERSRAVRERALRSADEKVARAEDNLKRAQADLAAGRAIRDDEWVGNRNGTVRPRQSYVDRVTALQDRVARAQAELDSAYEQRNYLR